jgi:hypothetical protein
MATLVNTPTTFECRCARARCGRTFGPYSLESAEDGGLWPIDHRDDGFGHVLGVNVYLGAEDGPRKGPRTGSGLYVESFGSESFGFRAFLRVKCKCGRNEKLGRAKLDETLFDAEGSLRLRDGVLYL